MISAGFSKVVVSPPIGAPLAGFAARAGVCEGIHDDLYSLPSCWRVEVIRSRS